MVTFLAPPPTASPDTPPQDAALANPGEYEEIGKKIKGQQCWSVSGFLYSVFATCTKVY